MPEGHARSKLREVDETEILRQAPVVPALGLLDPVQVFVQVLGVVERRAIDARELSVLLVASPVRAS
jgi:hypothetical protein